MQYAINDLCNSSCCMQPDPESECDTLEEQRHNASSICRMQGAFMAALYAQGLSWERIHKAVQHYARQIGSVRHLLSDLTLPIISVFTGNGFDRIVRETFEEVAQQIEDLWLRCGRLAEQAVVQQAACAVGSST